MTEQFHLPKVLCIDFMNLACRAGTSKFALGDHFVAFNLLRSLKSLIELHKPTRVYVVLEGRATKNLAILPEYKATRAKGKDEFYAQVKETSDFLSDLFPVSVVRHPGCEADDTIANIALNSAKAIEWTLVSTDTDFIQLIQDRPNFKVYNPVKKEFMSAPDYPYVVWKALSGDSCDNVDGLKGVGAKTAEKLARSPEELQVFLSRRSPEDREKFEKNLQVIRFWRWSDTEADEMTSSLPKRDWDAVKARFIEWEFNSMLKEPYWNKFIATFDPLWGNPLWQLV